MGIEKFDEMARLLGEARAQYEEFMYGKKVASTRARKALLKIKDLAHVARQEIQETKNAGAARPPGGHGPERDSIQPPPTTSSPS